MDDIVLIVGACVVLEIIVGVNFKPLASDYSDSSKANKATSFFLWILFLIAFMFLGLVLAFLSIRCLDWYLGAVFSTFTMGYFYPSFYGECVTISLIVMLTLRSSKQYALILCSTSKNLVQQTCKSYGKNTLINKSVFRSPSNS